MSQTLNSSTSPELLTLPEMLRIMDVATELRRQRETVEKQFAIDDTKRMLREKLLQATTVTGERVSEAEVDSAIDSYFSTLYTFHEPPLSASVTLAHLYVRRIQLGISSLLLLTVAGGGWWMLHTASRTFSKTVRQARESAPMATSINSLSQRILAVARENEVKEELDQWRREAEVAQRQFDTGTLKSISGRMEQLLTQLNSTYEVRINSEPGQRSGFTRLLVDKDGKRPAYYLIVSARNAQGQTIRRAVRSSETNQVTEVDQWAEQVPKEVYDRIAADKKADGILNETLFSIKQRGFREEEMKIPGLDNKPLERMGQIAQWKDDVQVKSSE